ncbi:MAG: 5'/3'-nucleotidase SurE [Bacteroidota bacterium]
MVRILISNDDGIHAPGILSLIEVAREFGDLTVVAPDSPQSGMGHAISIGKPLRYVEEELPSNLVGYACSGTPADCVKLATGVFMDAPPDLILSGINHGANSSVSAIYSGTLSAAREGAIQGIPSIGFSFLNFSHQADMTTAKVVVRSIISQALSQSMHTTDLLNVNIPDLPLSELKGVRITRQALGRWTEEFDQRIDPFGRKYFWLTGKFSLTDHGEDTDIHALNSGYVSVTPMTIDFTGHHSISRFASWDFSLKSEKKI